MIAAFEHRLEQIDGLAKHAEFAIEDPARDPSKPPHVGEHMRLTTARLQGEADWTRALVDRIRAGELWFVGEADPPWDSIDSASARVVGAKQSPSPDAS